MSGQKKQLLRRGALWLLLFAVWTGLIRITDVRAIGPGGSSVGLAALNGWFHHLTGVHLWLYTVTDWLGLVPVCVCVIFAAVGLKQLLERKGVWKVDRDILWLGVYYLLVIGMYLYFEMVPVNYRPILIEGRLEASYPSSTTLLVLSVMPTLVWQARGRLKNKRMKSAVCMGAMLFSVLMVAGRLLSGVHWLTDIVGAVLLSTGLFCMYKAVVL